MKIAIASDHAGFEYKEELKLYLTEVGYDISDFGCYDSASCDYPDFAIPLAKSVSRGEHQFGILICGSGIGMSIAANKVEGIRAANCCNVEMAKLARQHNDANILTFGARLIPFELAKEIAIAFINEKFEGNRHQRRIDKIHNLTGN
ncbi:MAG: ribose 5-phosphate isomerase B [Ignavibacteria bacterium]|nr:ribose 5-phosphate isomerase B [Ignavibacteria bacterium]